MQEKYTKKAFDVLQRAKEAAAKLGNEYIGTEHILLALQIEPHRSEENPVE